ncbi:S8 family serine peptidase [Actinophytocola sediminis]
MAVVAAGAAAGVVAPAAEAVPGSGGSPGAAPVGPTVTLLTGDTVTVGGPRGAEVRAGDGRAHVTFFTEQDERGDVHVVPEDAVSLLGQGKLDPRLFNVTELARSGYAGRSRLPLIVDYAGPTPRSAAARVSRELPVVGATAVSVERSGAYWPTARKAEHIWLDGRVEAALEHSVPQIGAPEAWQAGHTGAGATVAVLDTGVDVTHPDLTDAVVDARNFTDSDTTDDRNGHGTHLASTITGNGDRHQGVAPDAKLLNGKVLDDWGFGFESWIIAGMEWATASGADVVNLSIGGALPGDGKDPMSQAVNRLTEQTGTLFVIAAGNSGPTVGWVDSPGAAEAALTVGAVDRNDGLAGFSSRGPRAGDSGIKPDITAPGVDIVAARATNGQAGEPGERYVAMSGTSMATPHVAGAAAILAAQHPEWTAEQLKPALMGSARPTDGLSVFEQGAGRVDLAKAATTTVLATRANLSFGLAAWPRTDDQPIARTLTYTNTGDAPVSLDLTSRITAQDGSPAPQGMFTIAPTRLTVPAGGEASATVTADTTVDGPDGVFEGVVVATGDGTSVRTPIAVNREIESYNVTLRGIDHSGAPSDNYRYRFVPVAEPDKYHPFVYKPFDDVAGEVTVRLPRGEYSYNAVVQQLVGEDRRNAVFAEPAFVVTEDTELVFDARETRPADFTVDNPTAAPVFGFFRLARENSWGSLPADVSWPPDGSTTLKPSTTRSDDYTFWAEALLQKWDGESFDPTAYAYRVRHTDNAVPQNLKWHFLTKDLAKVRNEYAATVPGSIGGNQYGDFGPLPSTLIEYYTPDVPWAVGFYGERVLGQDGERVTVSSVSQQDPMTFRRGRTTTVRWGVGVFGPSLSGELGISSAGRFEDTMWFTLPMAVDQGRGRLGYSAGEGTTTLLRDGEVIAESSEWAGPYAIDPVAVGSERAEYTVRASFDRSAFAALSTKISSEWTFFSAHDADTVALPLITLRYAPNLDQHNTTPAGQRFTIPMYVERNGSDDAARVSRPTVEVSFDDGTTWQQAPVAPAGDDWQVTVDHPAGAEFVSLRSSVTDDDGSTQHQTIIRAYALR